MTQWLFFYDIEIDWESLIDPFLISNTNKTNITTTNKFVCFYFVFMMFIILSLKKIELVVI